MEKDVEKFWRWIEIQMAHVGISSITALEKEAGLSNGSISFRKRNHKFPTVEMATSLCQTLNVDWSELWANAGFINEQHLNNVQERKLITIYRRLDEQAKKYTISTLEALVQTLSNNR